MRNIIQIISLLLIITGCSSNDPYPITESIAKINEKQILDPMAPENNEGIVNDLDGVYGEKVVTSYQGSSVAPSEGQTSTNAQQLVSSGSGSSN
ncbi:hypothetical protein RI845_14155 [Thalassotalea nanhaiensis]|uniref:Uncharacterized protein n=1 Tax=Thalassotalea nanhaiensis TaxID=3065648 RepID=A0ABY9TIP1_9GAMM|nr:hypothetical protein RI845_14155 [Colwelliaceae bacterium SQ345]